MHDLTRVSTRPPESPACRLRPASLLLLALAWLATVLLPAGTVRGQGLPMLPDPMSTADVLRIADLLALSDEQRMSLEPLHDAYLDRFRRLRERDISTFKDEMLDVGLRFAANRFVIPPRDEIERLIDRYETLLEQISTVDRTLFTSMEPLLTDDQVLRLPRARNRRELQVYAMLASEMGGEFNPGAGVDLTTMVEGLDLDAEDAAASETILAGYESRRLARVKALDEVIRDAAIVVLDTIDELGLRDMTPEQMMELAAKPETIQTLETTFNEASRPFQAAAFALSQLNLRTFRQLVAALEPEATSDLRDRYYRRAYRRAYRGPGEWLQRYDEALALESLPADLAAQVRLERERYRRQEDQLVDGLVEEIESSREYRDYARLAGDEINPLREQIEETAERRETLRRQALATLDGLLGPELVARLDDDEAADGAPRAAAGAGSVTGGGGTGSTATRTAVEEPPPAATVATPPPLGVEDMQRYAGWIGWEDSDRAVLETLFDDYRRQYETRREAIAQATAPENADSPGADDERATDDDPVAALRDLDEAFHDDLAIIATDDAQRRGIERLRHIRRRTVTADVAREAGGDSGVRESTVDLGRVIFRSDLPRPDRAPLAPMLETYDREVTPLFEQRVEQVRLATQREAMWRATRGGSGAEAETLARAMYRRWREAEEELRGTESRIVEINRRALGEAEAALTGPAAGALRFTYQQAAYPAEFEDSRLMERIFEAALGLPDLAGRQQERLVEISSDFRSDYLDVTEQIVQQLWDAGRERNRDGRPRREEIERYIEIERLRFARREVCDRARLRLQVTLSEAQRLHLPDLSRPRGR